MIPTVTHPCLVCAAELPPTAGAYCPACLRETQDQAAASPAQGPGASTARVRDRAAADPLCEDCDGLLSEHTGPRNANPYAACKGFIPRGPKS